MEKVQLNQNMGKWTEEHGFKLSSNKEYEIDFEDELEKQMAIMQAIQTMGLEAMKDWFSWLETNDFSVEMPNPTNSFVKQFYGKKPLWKTKLSQGIVVKNIDDDDFYIVMECSRENEGFKHTQVILTLGGCM